MGRDGDRPFVSSDDDLVAEDEDQLLAAELDRDARRRSPFRAQDRPHAAPPPPRPRASRPRAPRRPSERFAALARSRGGDRSPRAHPVAAPARSSSGPARGSRTSSSRGSISPPPTSARASPSTSPRRARTLLGGMRRVPQRLQSSCPAVEGEIQARGGAGRPFTNDPEREERALPPRDVPDRVPLRSERDRLDVELEALRAVELAPSPRRKALLQRAPLRPPCPASAQRCVARGRSSSSSARLAADGGFARFPERGDSKKLTSLVASILHSSPPARTGIAPRRR